MPEVGAELDHLLMSEARKQITGANVHSVKTLLFCYETSAPGSDRRMKYEQALREFVAEKSRIRGALAYAEVVRDRSAKMHTASDGLDRKIETFFGRIAS